jgi:hypothetical protein
MMKSRADQRVEEENAAYNEWVAWQDVVKATTGVTITKKDWESPVTKTETPGQRALIAIRAWGEALVQLRRVQ